MPSSRTSARTQQHPELRLRATATLHDAGHHTFCGVPQRSWISLRKRRLTLDRQQVRQVSRSRASSSFQDVPILLSISTMATFSWPHFHDERRWRPRQRRWRRAFVRSVHRSSCCGGQPLCSPPVFGHGRVRRGYRIDLVRARISVANDNEPKPLLADGGRSLHKNRSSWAWMP